MRTKATRPRGLRSKPLIAAGSVAAAVLVGGALVAALWLTRGRGVGTAEPPSSPLQAGQAAAVDSKNLARIVSPPKGKGRVVYLPKPGGTFSFAFDVHNASSVPLRIDGAGARGGRQLRVSGLRLQPDPHVMAVAGAVAFHPITLRASAYRFLVVDLRTSCDGMAPHTNASLSTIALRYTWAGVQRDARLRLPLVVELDC